MFDLSRLTATGLIERFEFHQSLPSTNDRAALLAAEEYLACPALVLAAEQTAGRGRGGNQWWSATGGLMFSLILPAGTKTEKSPAAWPGFSLTAGLAICEALEQFCPHAHFAVKWPNDVFANDRKVCGILIESPAQARGRLIVGVGVNVNNSFAEAPSELQQSAIALCDLNGAQRDLTAVLALLLRQLERHWHELEHRGFSSLREAWLARSLLTGRTLVVKSGATTHCGLCSGIDEMGALLLQTEQGPLALVAGSVLQID